MKLVTNLLLLSSIIIMIFSAWSFNTFYRLSQANKTYPSNDAFEDACHLSTMYVAGGYFISILGMIIGLILLFISADMIRKNHQNS